MVRQVLSGCALAMVVASPGTAAAQNFLFGYQFGLVQTIGPRISNDPTIIDDGLDQNAVRTGTAAGTIANLTRLDVINLDTALTANVTMDLLGQIMNHGLVLGAQLNQTIPTAVVENAVAETADNQTGLVVNANYLGRIERPTWGLAVGAGYALTEDGRLGLNEDGTAGGAAAGSLPTAPLGPLRINAIQHDVNMPRRQIRRNSRERVLTD